jgi:hypothetical protein
MDDVERVGKLFPESFVDLLARFVPGTIFLLAYFWPHLSNQIPAIVDVGLVVIAYFIGLCAEVLSRILLSPLLRRILSALRPGMYQQSRDMLPQFERLSERQQSLLKKMMAESALFRACVILCVPLFVHRAPSPLPPLHYYAIVGVAMLLFLACHIDCQIHLRKRADVFIASLGPERNPRVERDAPQALPLTEKKLRGDVVEK